MDTKAYASLLAEIHCGILARISQGSYTLNGVGRAASLSVQKNVI
jgi:hypothetical protein